MMADRVNITIVIKYPVMYRFSIGIFNSALNNSKDQGQGHAYFHSEYLENGIR